MNIRKLETTDVEKYLGMLTQLDKETKSMLFEPGERTTSISQIKEGIKNKDSQTFIVDCNSEVVGFIHVGRGFAKRIKHTGYIVIGILQDFQGKGLGSKLLGAVVNWAEINGLKRLELTVMTHNEAAVNIYKKTGFEIEGIRKCAMLVDGKYVDEYYMGKII